MTNYETIGKGYNKKRTADDRILKDLVNYLKLKKGSRIADIGAGTGNYSLALANLGYEMEAVEPSRVMREQTIDPDPLNWHTAKAEALPFDDNSIDGIICILALHHFSDQGKAFNEMNRVCPKGPIVIFTFDPRESDGTWFSEYFLTIWNKSFSFFLSNNDIISDLASITGRKISSSPFPLPKDLTDHFAGSGWNRPEIYLDSDFRNGMSAFANEDQNIIMADVKRLSFDLSNGVWDKKYGFLREKESYDMGYKFIYAT